MKKSMQLPVIYVLTMLLFVVGIFWSGTANSGNVYQDINKNLKTLGRVYAEIATRYVDDVDSDKFLKAGLDGMLSTLDPYTQYIEQDEKHDLDVLTNGNYQGVGLILNYRNKVVTVADPPITGTPSARAGIRAGDKILKVDGVATSEYGFDDTAKHIRGPAGSEVTLTIQREGVEELLDFTLIREQITLEDVRYSGMLDGGIGYIQLTKFSKNAGPEIQAAIEKMGKKNLNGLILDLRGNPGGMLKAAVEVSDLFLPKGKEIVSTKGRTHESVEAYSAENPPLYGDKPLVILVNGGSASASEIVAGAVQDNDRGIIVGDTTFGKGLVQTVVPLSSTEAIKITTAKYYTPSGRCIQKKNYSIWSDSMQVFAKADFETSTGRSVSSGGGIIPDVIAQYPETTPLVQDLRRKSLFFNFAVHYVNNLDTLTRDFKVTDAIIDQFMNYLDEKGYVYTHPVENDLKLLKEEVLKKGYESQIILDIDKLQKSMGSIKEDLFLRSREDMRKILQMEIASKYFGVGLETEEALSFDPVVKKAVELIQDKEHYAHILVSDK